MRLTCSNCGYAKSFTNTGREILSRLVEGWNSVGSAMYCPECVRTWESRNGEGSSPWGTDHTKFSYSWKESEK